MAKPKGAGTSKRKRKKGKASQRRVSIEAAVASALTTAILGSGLGLVGYALDQREPDCLDATQRVAAMLEAGRDDPEAIGNTNPEGVDEACGTEREIVIDLLDDSPA